MFVTHHSSLRSLEMSLEYSYRGMAAFSKAPSPIQRAFTPVGDMHDAVEDVDHREQMETHKAHSLTDVHTDAVTPLLRHASLTASHGVENPTDIRLL